MLKYKNGDVIQLHNIVVLPGTLDFINIGLIVKTRNRFNIFKETEYLICLSDNLYDYYGIPYKSWTKWFKESEIKGKVQ